MEDATKVINQYLDTVSNKDSKTFYKTRIMKFFNDYMNLEGNQNKPLKAITFSEIDSFIKNLKSDNLNYYRACKGFFTYTYNSDITKEVMKGVEIPANREKDGIVYIDNKDILKFVKYTKDKSQPIIERLLIGFFIYTGLSRQYIENLTNHQINTCNSQFTLHFDTGEDGEVFIPLKQSLVDLINEYIQSQTKVMKRYDRIFSNYSRNYISTKVSDLSKKIVGRKYTPTDFSSTFIRNAILDGNDIYTVKRIVLESIGTIEKHIPEQYDVFEEQKKLLNTLYDFDK